MVARQIELGFLVHDGEIFELILHGKFVAKTQTVVKKPKTNNDFSRDCFCVRIVLENFLRVHNRARLLQSYS